MLTELVLSIPDYGDFKAPGGIPTGGLNTTGGKMMFSPLWESNGLQTRKSLDD